jgi:UDP-glucose 4-epimerase
MTAPKTDSAAGRHLLVTGGAGFIGSHLTDRWLAAGGRVTVLDDLSTGRLSNLTSAREHGDRLEFVRGSVLDAERVERCVAAADQVAHLAAVVGVARVCAQPERTLEVNSEGSRLVLEACARFAKPVIYASSSEVYGDSPRRPFREDQPLEIGSPQIPRWSYAISKAHGEALADALARDAGLRVTTVRFFNTTGPRQDPRSGMVLPRFVARALAGEPLEVYGDGAQTRSFCHVADTVEALMRLLVGERYGHVLNIGSDRELSIAELAERVVARLGSSSPVRVRAYAEVFGRDFRDMRQRVPSLERLTAAVGDWPRAELERIVDDLVLELGASRALELGASRALELGASRALELGVSRASELGSGAQVAGGSVENGSGAGPRPQGSAASASPCKTSSNARRSSAPRP